VIVPGSRSGEGANTSRKSNTSGRMTGECKMFKCEECGKVVGPKIRGKMKIIKTRLAIYEDEEGIERARGTEIVKEIRVCPECWKADKE